MFKNASILKELKSCRLKADIYKSNSSFSQTAKKFLKNIFDTQHLLVMTVVLVAVLNVVAEVLLTVVFVVVVVDDEEKNL